MPHVTMRASVTLAAQDIAELNHASLSTINTSHAGSRQPRTTASFLTPAITGSIACFSRISAPQTGAIKMDKGFEMPEVTGQALALVWMASPVRTAR